MLIELLLASSITLILTLLLLSLLTVVISQQQNLANFQQVVLCEQIYNVDLSKSTAVHKSPQKITFIQNDNQITYRLKNSTVWRQVNGRGSEKILVNVKSLAIANEKWIVNFKNGEQYEIPI